MLPSTPSIPPPRLSQPPMPDQEIDGADADLFDYAKLRDYLVYVVHAVQRRKLLFAATAAGTIAAAFVALAVMPKTYHCEIKIQAQRNMVISTLAGLQRSYDWDLPTHAASDLVLRHDNLVSLVRKIDLVKAIDTTRAPIQRLGDAIWGLFRGQLSAEAKENGAVATLEQKLVITTTDDTVTIGVDWPDARTAYRIIQAAHQNFLEARQYKEVSAVSEAIGLLEGRAAAAHDAVRVALERVYKLRGSMPKPAKAKPVAAPAPARPAAVMLDPEVQQLRGQLQSKRQVILEMEDFRRRRISELSAKLAELKSVYSEFHPAVVDLQETLAEQEKEENPQLTAVRQEYRELEQRYEKMGGPPLDAPETLSSARLPAEAVQISTSTELETPEVEQAKADLKHEMGRYSTLTDRIDQAKMELETQRAAFQYRYGVLRPPAMPLSPEKPKRRMVVLAAALAGAILGVIAAALADIRSRRILEPWQVRRQLGLEVLAEVGE